jgi:zinc-ribbon domain
MYCPRCGQQQLSDEVRFCSRCGLPLASVPALLAGEAAPTAGGATRKGILAGKRPGVRRGAKLMFFSVVLFPIFLAFSIAADSPGPLVVPFMLLLAGLAFLLYSVLFGEELLPARGSKNRDELSGAHGAQQSLPPSTFVPASGFGRQPVNTADMSRPPSVTEQTTRLLDED